MKQFWFRRKVNPPPAATRIKAGDFLKCVQILRENNLCFPPPILEPKSAFEDGRSFIKFLEKKGFKAIGIGHYSTVLAKDKSTRVIKISRTPDNWISYITWAANNGYAGTFAPKVYSYKYIKGKKSPFYVAIVERMDKTFHHVRGDHPIAFIPKLLDYTLHYANDNASGIGKFADDFKKAFAGQRWDTHRDNFMIRENGTLCLTDPVCGEYDTTSPIRFKEKRIA